MDIYFYLCYICRKCVKIKFMKSIETANDHTHRYSKKFDRYLKVKSTRSLEAIVRTKRLDAGFFWMEFMPLVRDIFLAEHPEFNEKQLDVLLQLHANQPFCQEDIYKCTAAKIGSGIHLDKKTTLGRRAAKDLMDKCIEHGYFKLFKQNGRYNKKLYYFSYKLGGDIKRMYEQMLCLSQIEIESVPKEIRNSIVHYRKMVKQNSYKKKFEEEKNREIFTSDRDFSIKLKQARNPK